MVISLAAMVIVDLIAWPSDLGTIVTFIACAAVHPVGERPRRRHHRGRHPRHQHHTNPLVTCLVFVPLVFVPGIYLIAPDGFGLRDGPGELDQH
jgi:hypothetical protein